MEKLEQLLTVQQVAELLQMDPGHVYRMAGKKQIPCKRIGGAVRFSPSELKKWLNLN